MSRVHLGYFENFKGNDTLLMEGDTEGLRHLAAVLRSLESGSASRVELDTLPFVEAHHGVQLIASCFQRDFVARVEHSSNKFIWDRTSEGWRDAADVIDVLVDCEKGHQYLDAPHDQIMIQVSKGEYGSDWWNRHG